MTRSSKMNATIGFFLVVIIFLSVAFFLTFNIISLPSLVIGDNFNWTPQNVIDITGPRIIRESYMGDIAVLSTFKTGFLFPLTYLGLSLNLPSTIVYPLLFYFLSMLSFYFLTKEFLKSQTMRIVISILYVINPVTPYYFASLINAFSLVILPLGIKFFVRVLREIDQNNKSHLIRNFLLTAFFLALCVSANEQFIFSVLLITAFMLVTFGIVLFRKIGSFVKFTKFYLLNLLGFVAVFCVVNLPLFISTINIQKTTWSTYFQGPSSSQFIPMVDYTYKNADLTTLLRLGGDGGTGLGQTSWYDSSLFTNVFGYVLLVLLVASVLLILLKKDGLKVDRPFFYQSILLFVVTLIIVLFIKTYPAAVGSTGAPFDSLLKTWESPSKLRVVLLISLLATSLGSV